VLGVEDGDVVDLVDGVARTVGQVDASFIFVDGATVGDISDSSLMDRRILGEEGFISIVAAVDLSTHTLVSGPDLHARGFLDDPHLFDEVATQVRDALVDALDDGQDDVAQLRRVMRRVVGQWVTRAFRARPMIVPVVIAVCSRSYPRFCREDGAPGKLTCVPRGNGGARPCPRSTRRAAIDER
jgi:ribonuclease J